MSANTNVNEKTSAGKNDAAKEVDSKVESAKQNSSDKTEPKELDNGGLKADEVLTSTMTGQVVAKKSDEKQIEKAEEAKPSYDDFLNQRNEEREIQGGEQIVASGLDKGRPINGDGLIDSSVPSHFEQRFGEAGERAKK